MREKISELIGGRFDRAVFGLMTTDMWFVEHVNQVCQNFDSAT